MKGCELLPELGWPAGRSLDGTASRAFSASAAFSAGRLEDAPSSVCAQGIVYIFLPIPPPDGSLALPLAFRPCCRVPGGLHGEEKNQGQETTCGVHVFFPLPAVQNRRGKDPLGLVAPSGPTLFPFAYQIACISYFFYRNTCRS